MHASRDVIAWALVRMCLNIVLVQVLLEASNGASDYGNKFGEPLIAGYTRTFGMRLPDGQRREWIKPIMFRCCNALVSHASCLYALQRLT